MAAYSRTKLARYIADQIAEGASEDRIAQSVAAYLIEAGKTADLESLMRDVQEIRAEEQGVVELVARSAFPLDASEKSQIEAVAKRQYPNTKKVIMHEEHDETVIGGASLSMSQANLDVTIRSKLNRLREAVS
jgi:F0F1-type ATP synthase delta subunit